MLSQLGITFEKFPTTQNDLPNNAPRRAVLLDSLTFVHERQKLGHITTIFHEKQ